MDDIGRALQRMQENSVRRLPVEDEPESPRGIAEAMTSR
jgi:hypothetical protein